MLTQQWAVDRPKRWGHDQGRGLKRERYEGESCIIVERSLISCCLNSPAALRSSSWTDFGIHCWQDNQAVALRWIETCPQTTTTTTTATKNPKSSMWFTCQGNISTFKCSKTALLGNTTFRKSTAQKIIHSALYDKGSGYSLRPATFTEHIKQRIPHLMWHMGNRSD